MIGGAVVNTLFYVNKFNQSQTITWSFWSMISGALVTTMFYGSKYNKSESST